MSFAGIINVRFDFSHPDKKKYYLLFAKNDNQSLRIRSIIFINTARLVDLNQSILNFF